MRVIRRGEEQRPYSKWRDEIVPLVWFAAALLILFVVANAASAHAEPSPASDPYGVCPLLDQHPTVGGVIDALDTLRAAGLSSRAAGGALLDAITNDCERHAGLLDQVTARAQERTA